MGALCAHLRLRRLVWASVLLALLLLLWTGHSVAQTVNNACGNSTKTGSTIAVTLASSGGTSGCTSNVAANDLLLVSCGDDSTATVNAPTDTQSNTWTQAASITGTSGAGNAKTYSAIAKSSGSDTITCNLSASGADPHIDAREVAPPSGSTWTGTVLDQTGTGQSTSTTPSVSTSGATTQATEIVYAFLQDSPNSRTITVGSGYSNFVLSNDTSGGDSAAGESKDVSSTGTQTAAFGGTSGDAVVMVITTWKANGSVSNSHTITETLSFSDAIARNVGRFDTETLSFSDSLQRNLGHFDTETLSSSDSIARNVSRSMAESLSSSDSLGINAGRFKSMSETSSPSDSIVKNAAHGMAESLSLSESLHGQAAMANLAETLSSSDSLAASTAHFAVIVSGCRGGSNCTTDGITAGFAYSRTAAETLSPSDSVGKMVSAETAESLSSSDAIKAASSHSMAETLSPTDSIGTSVPRSRVMTDSVSVSDSIARVAGHQVSASEALSGSDSISKSYGATKSATESLTHFDMLTTGRIVETLSHSDSISPQLARLQTVAETVSPSDSIGVVVGHKKKKVVIVW